MKVINFENSDSDNNKCLVCGQEGVHTQKIVINRPFRNENIISFNVCDDCLIEMYGDIENQLDFLNDCENFRRD